ncbi:transglutaminase-like cysteine peptidase [Tolumonas lignilytica]|jgi:Predicted periplasmic protein|uniref:transglutaminase-like cysteine peptidase n=1 Tax=Tolumonas lignilytica TaxID=1283284 RepID=UPI0004B59501|nr:transglutaminase-like cysteine peptidase [Tolumonas lignilytica]
MTIFSLNKRFWHSILFLLILLCSGINYQQTLADAIDTKDRQLVELVQAKYGSRAARRVIDWRLLIHRALSEKWSHKQILDATNNFFNRLIYIEDVQLWGKSNYWASPVEFLGAGGGDCKSFSIAKYFTLREMGISDESLRLIYVKAVRFNRFHMVVADYATPTSMPVILDNIDPVIKPANLRTDLVPVYSFNGSHLWLMKAKGQGQLAGSSDRLSLWSDLQTRINAQNMNKPILNLDN